MLKIAFLASIVGVVGAYENVNGGELQRCSGSGMALTGFTRNGHCVDQVRGSEYSDAVACWPYF